jgi:hypothetical protein
MTEAVLPSRVPHPAEELVEKTLRGKDAALFSNPNLGTHGIVEVIYVPETGLRAASSGGVFKIVCDVEQAGRVKSALKIEGITGENPIGQDELYVDAIGLGTTLGITSQLRKLISDPGHRRQK